MEDHSNHQGRDEATQTDAEDTRADKHEVGQEEESHLEVEVTSILEYLALQVVVIDLDDLGLEFILLFISSDESEAIEGLREVSVLLLLAFLHHSACLSLTVHGVALEAIQEVHVDGHSYEHVGREVDSECNLKQAVSY